MIAAIDPGTEQSALLFLNDGKPEGARIYDNADLLKSARQGASWAHCDCVAIEMIACYGMPVGKETFETVLFIGQLKEALEARGVRVRLVYRREVKIWLCGSMKAKDGNIRQALIDKHGAPGTKANPGKLYGIKSHLWSALAIADFAINNPEK